MITALVKLAPGNEEQFLSEAKGMIEATLAEEGNIGYQLLKDPFTPDRYMFMEEWRDDAAIDVHFAMPHFGAFGRAIAPMLASPLEIKIIDVAAEKAV